MWMVGTRVGLVWVALIAMYAMCVYGKWPATSDEWAQWVGAIGTVGAALWAAWTYWRDRNNAREDANRLQRLSAWRQAMLVRSYLELARRKLRAITETLDESKPSGQSHAPMDALIVPEFDGIADNLRDVTSFGSENSAALLRFVSKGRIANQYVSTVYFQWPVTTAKAVGWGKGQRDAWRELANDAERLSGIIEAIANDVPAH